MGLENTIEQKKKAAVEALYQNKGNVSTACSAIGIGRTQFYQWKKEDLDFAAAVDNVTDFCIDHVESKLHAQIDKGDTTAMIFYLKTIGKRRGYIERSELTGAEGKPLVPEDPLAVKEQKLVISVVNATNSPAFDPTSEIADLS